MREFESLSGRECWKIGTVRKREDSPTVPASGDQKTSKSNSNSSAGSSSNNSAKTTAGSSHSNTRNQQHVVFDNVQIVQVEFDSVFTEEGAKKYTSGCLHPQMFSPCPPFSGDVNNGAKIVIDSKLKQNKDFTSNSVVKNGINERSKSEESSSSASVVAIT